MLYIGNPLIAFGPVNFIAIFLVAYRINLSKFMTFYGFFWSYAYFLIILFAILVNLISELLNLTLISAFIVFYAAICVFMSCICFNKRNFNFLDLPKKVFNKNRLIAQLWVSVIFFLMPIFLLYLLKIFYPLELKIDELNSKGIFALFLLGDFSNYFSYLVSSSLAFWFYSPFYYAVYVNTARYIKNAKSESG
ncbi:hypothetical protein FIV00_22750 [Labrenzia sp. THAF82]|nr:hypothetical protein FIV00_22750 [Labrenzia sp. THAF82]